jgi:hypothetical protein
MRKLYRLKRPSLFMLSPKKLWLAEETDRGYVIKVAYKQWIGLPKFNVENNKALFEPYNRDKHMEARRKRNHFINAKNKENV